MAIEYDEKKKIEEQRTYLVIKSNRLVQQARYDLNITELKVLSYLFSKIKPDDKNIQEYSFSIKEYCEICGINYKYSNNYEYIKRTIKKLRDKSFWMSDEKGNEILMGWLQNVKINRGSGIVKVKLDENLHEFVIGLFRNYLSYELLSTLPMKSKYSFRIYELLKSYAFQKKHTFDIDELKKKLSAENYTNFNNFRKYVLDVAEREINKFTDIEIDWKPIYKGRKVIQVTFDIKQRDSWGKYLASQKAIKELDG